MKELVAVKPSTPVLKTYQDREVEADEVKVKVQFGAPKHGTELTMYRGISPFQEKYYDTDWKMFLPNQDQEEIFPMGLGNMWVGEIIEKGSEVKELKIGQRIAGYGNLRNTCIIKEEAAFVMPDRMTWKEAMCYDPARFALGAVRDGGVKIGDRVVVFGLGAIGLLAAQMARKAGAVWVAVVDPIEKRRKAALDNGADLALDPLAVDIGLEIKKQTDKKGVDVAIEISGAYPALQQAIRSTAYNGTVSVAGWYKECKGGIHFGEEAHFNIPNIVFSRACSNPDREYPRWDLARVNATCWQMLSAGWYNCENIVDPVVDFTDIVDAYKKYVDQHPEESVKLGVKFEE